MPFYFTGFTDPKDPEVLRKTILIRWVGVVRPAQTIFNRRGTVQGYRTSGITRLPASRCSPSLRDRRYRPIHNSRSLSLWTVYSGHQGAVQRSTLNVQRSMCNGLGSMFHGQRSTDPVLWTDLHTLHSTLYTPHCSPSGFGLLFSPSPRSARCPCGNRGPCKPRPPSWRGSRGASYPLWE